MDNYVTIPNLPVTEKLVVESTAPLNLVNVAEERMLLTKKLIFL